MLEGGQRDAWLNSQLVCDDCLDTRLSMIKAESRRLSCWITAHLFDGINRAVGTFEHIRSR